MTFILLLAFNVAQAQDVTLTQSKVFYGGSVGVNFGSDYWLANIAPTIGYRLTPSVSTGLGGLYQYESSNSINNKYSIHSYGGNVFLRYSLEPVMQNLPFSIFFQTDYEGTWNDFTYKNQQPSITESKFINRLYLGVGYMQSVSARSRLFVLVSFDALDKSPRPVIRGGFIF